MLEQYSGIRTTANAMREGRLPKAVSGSKSKKRQILKSKVADGRGGPGVDPKAKGFAGFNKPKRTPDHPTKKGAVLAKEGDKVKLIRFGDQNMGHNYSAGARASFKARHGKNIAKGKMSAAYWADKFFWAGPKGQKKSPPKSQKIKR